MPDQLSRSQGTQPPPTQAFPQRLSHGTTPASVAPAHHHNLAAAPPQPALESTRQRSPRRTGPVNALTRRLSSDESDETSDPKKWFNRSNENPGQSFGSRRMDIDPPFFQKESDSSNGEAGKDGLIFPFGPRHYAPLPAHLTRAATTSSAEDYRSVIDDLTIEINRLKEELRRYKHNVPESLRKDALFEVRMYGLKRREKRELENILREFATGIEGSAGNLPGRRKLPKHANRLLPSSGSDSKHGTPLSGHSRPLDSAYASISTTGTGNSNLNMPGGSAPHASLPDRAKSAEQKVQSYIEDIPEGLFPRNVAMTENERKKLIVRRLEKLFTGKIGGKNSRRVFAPGSEPPGQQSTMSLPLSVVESTQPSREARILLLTGDRAVKKTSPGGNTSASVSGREQAESGGAGTGINYRYGNGSGNNCGNTTWSGNGNSSGRSSGRGNLTSPQSGKVAEQRPTRPHDLDPDRIQLPSENMDYIRHLGLVGPPNLSDSKFSTEDVPVDKGGWIYLNLLCNMAQLHILNVTPAFIRKAVSEKSTKFQLSPDGQKIRWRGGTDGTKFSSDNSDYDSQRSSSTDEESSVTRPQRKKQKTRHSRNDLAVSTSSKSRRHPSKTGLSISNPSDTFHYKPLFAHHSPSIEQNSDDASSIGSLDRGGNSNRNSTSKWDYGGRGFSQYRQRRAGGAIVFYNGTPFVTDLSRDHGDKSSSTDEASPTGKLQDKRELLRSEVQRAQPGSAVQTRSLKRTDPYPIHEATNVSQDKPGSRQDDSDWDLDSDVDIFPWSEDRQKPQEPRLFNMEAAGLGGVIPEDHFTVHVTTRRPIRGLDANSGSGNKKTRSSHHIKSKEATDSLSRIARMSKTSPTPRSQPSSRNSNHPIEISYLPGKVRKLEPVPLPPPVTFLPPFSSDSDEAMSDSDSSDERDESAELGQLQDIDDREELMSRLANPRLSNNSYPEDSDLNSTNGQDEIDPEAERAYDASGSSDEHLPMRRAGSSSAIAEDGIGSGYSSSEEEDTSMN